MMMVVFKILENFKFVYDVMVVEKFNVVGVINVGKVNLDEFVMGLLMENFVFKMIKNLWDLIWVLGGFFGGFVVVVVVGDVLGVLGFDIGGLIWIFVFFIGMVGMKLIYGWVFCWGLIVFGFFFD